MPLSSPALERLQIAPTLSSSRLDFWLAVACNLGVTMFLLGAFWQLGGDPSATVFDHSLKLGLIYGGIGIAGPAWVAGLRTRSAFRAVLIGAILAVAVCSTLQSARDFDAANRVLNPGHFDGDSWVHDGLGLSLAMLPGWRSTLKLPFVVDSNYECAGLEGRLRLLPGERAVMFEMEAHPGESNSEPVQRTIRVEATRFDFSTPDAVARYVRSRESVIASMPGTAILRSTHSYQMDGLEFVEFDFGSERRNSVVECIFVRSGSYLLSVTHYGGRDDKPEHFQAFLKSIRIADRRWIFGG